MTATDGATLSAVDYNKYVRDNFLETAPANASTVGSYFVCDGVNSIVERRCAEASVLDVIQTTTSTSYTNLSTSGPAVTVTTGTRAIVWITLSLWNSLSNMSSYASHEISGASGSIAATDQYCFRRQGVQVTRGTCAFVHTALTPGSNTFTMKYRVAGGTGNFDDRTITVMPF
jgi:hypothetical protein